jgi:hypothetical protein
MKSSWPEYRPQAKPAPPHVAPWPYAESRERLRAIATMLRVSIDQAAKLSATIRLSTDDKDGALRLCAELLRPTPSPTDATVDRVCDQVFDHYRERWWP